MPQWSDKQQNFYDTVDGLVKAGQGGAILLDARPGSGKTTTAVEAVKNHTHGLQALFLAFNRDIAEEVQRRMPDKKSSTNHAFGRLVCAKALGKFEVKDMKERWILERYLDKYNWGFLFHPILQLVGFVKKNLIDDWSDASLQSLADFYGIELNGDGPMTFDKARIVLEKSEEELGYISFDDMMWLPYRLDLNAPKYDYISLDEAQDTSPAAMDLFLRALHQYSIWVGVGDPWQSINGFAGAGINSMEILQQRMGATVLPLDITYRCPKAVVQLINQTFSHISFTAAPNAIEGEVCWTDFGKTNFQPGDMVLCRTNAPLVRPCFSLIRRGIKATIKGRNIGEGLQALVKKFKTDNLSSLLSKITDYRDEEVYKLRLAKKEGQAAGLEDKVETVIALSDGCYSVQDVLEKCRQIFDDKTIPAVTFSSGHKAKGLEADNVFILKPELMPHPAAKSDWEKQQEENVKFVSWSRPKKKLVFVSGV